jgi:hypothetical protein
VLPVVWMRPLSCQYVCGVYATSCQCVWCVCGRLCMRVVSSTVCVCVWCVCVHFCVRPFVCTRVVCRELPRVGVQEWVRVFEATMEGLQQLVRMEAWLGHVGRWLQVGHVGGWMGGWVGGWVGGQAGWWFQEWEVGFLVRLEAWLGHVGRWLQVERVDGWMGGWCCSTNRVSGWVVGYLGGWAGGRFCECIGGRASWVGGRAGDPCMQVLPGIILQPGSG